MNDDARYDPDHPDYVDPSTPESEARERRQWRDRHKQKDEHLRQLAKEGESGPPPA